MVGFLGAIAGGAMKGWSAGQMQEIKDKREEKLKLLDQEFNRSENALTREVQRQDLASREKMGLAQIASQEKLTGAQLGVQKSIAELQAANQKSIAELGEGGATARSAAQIQAQKDIAQLQIDAANVPTLIQTKTGYAWQKKDGSMMPAPTDPATGKPLEPLISKDDTPEITNYKYLMSLPGIDPDAAKQLSFGSKNADPTVVLAGLYKANLEAIVGDFSSGATEEQMELANTRAEKQLKVWQQSATPGGTTKKPAEPDDPTKPDATSTTEKKTLTPAERQKAVNDARTAVKPTSEGGLGKNKQAVAKWLEDKGIKPSEAGL